MLVGFVYLSVRNETPVEWWDRIRDEIGCEAQRVYREEMIRATSEAEHGS